MTSAINLKATEITSSVSENYATKETLNNNYSTTEQTANMISTTVSQAIKNNLEEDDSNEDENGEIILLNTTMIEMEIFNTNKKPSTPIKKFLERVVKYCQPEP
jgi:arsenate reductase-like glutaredoxin family protein